MKPLHSTHFFNYYSHDGQPITLPCTITGHDHNSIINITKSARTENHRLTDAELFETEAAAIAARS